MNKITHETILPFIQDVDQLVEDAYEEDSIILSATGIVLSVIETVQENASEWVSSIQLVITTKGYEVHYVPTDAGDTLTSDSLVMGLLYTGLGVQRESIFEPID